MLQVGQEQLHEPVPAEVVAALNASYDVEQLEQFTLRVLKVSSWEELPSPPPKKSRRRRSSS